MLGVNILGAPAWQQQTRVGDMRGMLDVTNYSEPGSVCLPVKWTVQLRVDLFAIVGTKESGKSSPKVGYRN